MIRIQLSRLLGEKRLTQADISRMTGIRAEISKALSYSGYENSLARSIDMQSLPVDKESRYSLVRVDEPVETLDPVLDEYTRAQLDDFIHERQMLFHCT